MRSNNADADLQASSRQVAEALEQQTATSEVLGLIAGSRGNVGPILDAVAEHSARLCDGGIVNIHRIQDGLLHLAAIFSVDPDARTTWEAGDVRPISRTTVTGRAVMDRRSIHVHDLAAAVEADYRDSRRFQQIVDHRTILATPLLREGEPVGAITIGRWQVRPFTEAEIGLLETFADQAVIAIENARLFEELRGSCRRAAGARRGRPGALLLARSPGGADHDRGQRHAVGRR